MIFASSGLRFEEVLDAVVWHSDVRVFSVFDLSSNDLLGYFYLDIYKRFNDLFGCYIFTSLIMDNAIYVIQQGREICSHLCGSSPKWCIVFNWRPTGKYCNSSPCK